MPLAALRRPDNPRFDDEAAAIITMRPGAPTSPTAKVLAWTRLMQAHANTTAAPSAPAARGA